MEETNAYLIAIIQPLCIELSGLTVKSMKRHLRICQSIFVCKPCCNTKYPSKGIKAILKIDKWKCPQPFTFTLVGGSIKTTQGRVHSLLLSPSYKLFYSLFYIITYQASARVSTRQSDFSFLQTKSSLKAQGIQSQSIYFWRYCWFVLFVCYQFIDIIIINSLDE